jgi:hypothetical protein
MNSVLNYYWPRGIVEMTVGNYLLLTSIQVLDYVWKTLPIEFIANRVGIHAQKSEHML